MTARGGRGRVDVSLTSIASRLTGLDAVIGSLLAQDHDDLRVHLHLSREPHLLDTGVDALPEALRALAESEPDRLAIHWVANTGPYRKLIPYLWHHWGQSRLVVTADDDTLYPTDWLRGLVDAHDTYGCCIAQRGHAILVRDGVPAPYRGWMRTPPERNPDLLLLPTGKDGVLYDTAFFPPEVLDMPTALRIAPTVDDLWFRWHLIAAGIPVHLRRTDYTDTLTEAEIGDSLYLSYNQAGGNDAAVDRLERHLRARFGHGVADIAAARDAVTGGPAARAGDEA